MTTADVVQYAGLPEELSDAQWEAIEKRADRLAQVSYIPEAYRGKPADIMAAGLALAAVGKALTPLTLRLVYVVHGTVDFMFDLISALVHEAGHEMWVVERTPTSATVSGQRRGGDRVHTVTFTEDDARRAGLPGRNPTYKTYPTDMYVARAGKRLAKEIAPEAMLGLPPPMAFAPTEGGRLRAKPAPDDDIEDAELVDVAAMGERPPLPPDEPAMTGDGVTIEPEGEADPVRPFGDAEETATVSAAWLAAFLERCAVSALGAEDVAALCMTASAGRTTRPEELRPSETPAAKAALTAAVESWGPGPLPPEAT